MECENDLFPMASWVDSHIEITLDSGCCEHVMDIDSAPGYCNFITQSPGSKRKQHFVVGNGQRVPNEGQVRLNMQFNGTPLASTFQVAEVTRPLMSVGRVCDQGLICTFDDERAIITDKHGRHVCRFERSGGLYVARLDLKDPRIGLDEPGHFGRQAP